MCKLLRVLLHKFMASRFLGMACRGRDDIVSARMFPASCNVEAEFEPALNVGNRTIICMTLKFSIFGSSSTPQLGPFEQQLLRELWSRGSATVREMIADGSIHQAYTTVMTTMDRLYKKGLLDRVAEGRAFRYTPRLSSEELQRGRALDGIRQLLGSNDTSVSAPLLPGGSAERARCAVAR